MAAKKIKKISTPSEKDAKVAQDALDLHEGILALAERQKHIRIADQAKNSWRAVALYKAGGLGDSKEDNDKIKQADKEAELDWPQSRRESLPDKQRRIPVLPPPPPVPPPIYPAYGPQWHQPGPPPSPQPMFQPPPPRQGFMGTRPIGPCFNFSIWSLSGKLSQAWEATVSFFQ